MDKLDPRLIEISERCIDEGTLEEQRELHDLLAPRFLEAKRNYDQDKENPIYRHNLEIMILVMMNLTLGMMTEKN